MRKSEIWEHWWIRKAPPHTLAVLRITFGLWLLFYWGMKLPVVAMLYSYEGISLPAFPVAFLEPPPLEIAWALFALLLLSLLLVTIGLFTRISFVYATLLCFYFWLVSEHLFGTSFDRLYIFTLFVLTFSGSDRTFSVAMLLKRGSFFAWEPISILPQRLLALQVSATYLGVGWQKLWLPAWQMGGEVLAYGFVGRWASALADYVIAWNMPMWVYDASVLLVKGFEITVPFGLWIRKTRWWFIVGTAIFHISITLLLNIWWFLIMIPMNILFLEPEEVYGFLKDHARNRIR